MPQRHQQPPVLTKVTFSGNSASTGGGGMFNISSSPTLTNVTFSGNSAYTGGGMYNQQSSPTLTNVTFSGNSASGNLANTSGGIHNWSGNLTLKNVIIANSTNGDCLLDGSATLGPASSNNLIESTLASGRFCGLDNGDGKNSIVGVDPLLGSLDDYGGATETVPLLPGSPAINAGAGCPPEDQRDVSRVGTCDIGAFESRGFTLDNLTGTPQSATVNTAFFTLLGLTATANDPTEPVDGGQVTFTPPGSGASASVTASPATIAGGTVSVAATANGTTGSYTVIASATGMGNSLNFLLTNTPACSSSVTVTSTADSGGVRCARPLRTCALAGPSPSTAPLWPDHHPHYGRIGHCQEPDH